MRSNFDSPLKVTDGVVEACGELEWAGESQAFVTVTLTQRGTQAVGAASSHSPFEPPGDEWMLEVESAGGHGFTPGPAHAIGVLSAVEGGSVSVFHWGQDVQLAAA
jgi:hypothetical protein